VLRIGILANPNTRGAMMKTWLFYSYDKSGRDVVLRVSAFNRELAIAEFDRRYGLDTTIDFIVEEGQQFDKLSD
jgi:hypothetical protein